MPNRKTVLILTLAICFAGVVFFSAKPSLELIKTIRAKHLASQADAEMQAGRYDEAQQKILSAIQLKANHPDVLKSRGKYLNLVRHPGCVGVWNELIRIEPLNPENWKGLFDAALATEDKRLAMLAFTGFEKAAPNDVHQQQVLRFQLVAASGNTEAAIRIARSIWDDMRTTDRFRLQASEWLLRAESESRTKAVVFLENLVSNQSALSLPALTILAKRSDLDASQRKHLAEQMESHPDATFANHLLAQILRIDPGFSPEENQKVWTSFAEKHPFETRILMARWLQKRGESTAAALLIPEAEALTNRDSTLLWLDRYAESLEWDSIEALLESPDCPLPDSLRWTYLAKVSEGRGDSKRFELRWRRALAAARNDPLSLGFMANYASASRWHAEAESACRELMKFPKHREEALIGLYQLGKQSNNSKLTQEALGLMQTTPGQN
jgi:tetratricopeptide (TPR) repeat protein